jgi:hypothetical protein
MDLWGASVGRVSVLSVAVDLKLECLRWNIVLGAYCFLNLAILGGLNIFIEHPLFRTRNQLEIS